MLDRGKVPVGIWADWLEEQGEDVSLLRAMIDIGFHIDSGVDMVTTRSDIGGDALHWGDSGFGNGMGYWNQGDGERYGHAADETENYFGCGVCYGNDNAYGNGDGVGDYHSY